jgi:hypothetical protein
MNFWNYLKSSHIKFLSIIVILDIGVNSNCGSFELDETYKTLLF